MSWKLFGLSIATFSSLCSVCQAAPNDNQGVIKFNGSVVEAPCSTSSLASSWRLEGCPSQGHAPDITVRSMGTVPTTSALDDPTVQIKLIASNTQGRYYNQQYILVGKTGETVKTGHYLITLTEH